MAEIIKTTGIVLKSSKHTVDAARLLEIFSPEMGRFTAVIRGVEKPKAKLAIASQPFCFGEFMLAEKKGFYTVTDCFVQDSFFDIAYNLDAFVLGSSLLEATSKFALVGEKNVELFMLLLKSLKAMAYDKAEPTAVAIKYFMNLLKISGFGFDLHNCFICGKEIGEQELSRDHVIPWSYMYSDDLWNIVYVHKGCNSSKSNITPSQEVINNLKERNNKLKELLHIKYRDRNLKLLQEFDYAIEHDYVDKFYLGCKGC